MKIAFVYDWLDKWGGVERLILTFLEIFPQADLYTSFYDQKKAFWLKKKNIFSSFMQFLPEWIKKSRIFSLPFFPFAFETFNFNDYDLVISISSSFAKGIITQPKTKHINIMLTPTRFLWVMPEVYFSNKKKYDLYLNYLKKWDKVAAFRPDKIISISQTVYQRCKKIYNRESEVIYPPFDKDYWQKEKEKNDKTFLSLLKKRKFYLIVSRLEKYKKIDLAIKVFNKLNRNLIIIGSGSEEKFLKKIAQKNIFFLKNLTDSQLASFYKNAYGLIAPQEEDFGYVFLEAIFFDLPIIAFQKGGATEVIFEGKTGIFFQKQDEDSLNKAVFQFEKSYSLLKNYLKENKDKILNKFSKDLFIKKIKNLVK